MVSRPPSPLVVTLTLNPAVDLSVFVDRLAPGEKLRCQEPRRDAGGGGVNVARVVQRLGGRAVAVFPAGGAGGERLCAMLAAQRLPHIACEIAGETREDFTAEVRESGDQYRFVMPGPRLSRSELHGALDAALAKAPQCLVASGSLPPGAPITFYASVATQARRAGARVALDASGRALAHGLDAGVWLVKPNLDELRQIAGADLPALPERLAACRSLIARGAAKIVALSMGDQGGLLVTESAAFQARAPAITPLSVVGAGDSFMGGLVQALTIGLACDEALGEAVAAGSAALLAPGTQLCRAADVRRLRGRVCVSAV